MIHGAAGGVGSIAVQLARGAGAVVIGTGRAADRDTALGLGAHAFLDLQADKDRRAIFFVVEPDRSQLAELAQRLRGGRLKPLVGAVRPLAEAPAAFAPDRRTPGKTVIRVTEGG